MEIFFKKKWPCSSKNEFREVQGPVLYRHQTRWLQWSLLAFIIWIAWSQADVLVMSWASELVSSTHLNYEDRTLLTVMILNLGSSSSVYLMYCASICRIPGDANQVVFKYRTWQQFWGSTNAVLYLVIFLFFFFFFKLSKSPVCIQQYLSLTVSPTKAMISYQIPVRSKLALKRKFIPFWILKKLK